MQRPRSILCSILKTSHPPLFVDRLNPTPLIYTRLKPSYCTDNEPAEADAYGQVPSEVERLDRELGTRASEFEVLVTGTLDAMITFERLDLAWPEAFHQRGLHNYINSAVSVSSSSVAPAVGCQH